MSLGRRDFTSDDVYGILPWYSKIFGAFGLPPPPSRKEALHLHEEDEAAGVGVQEALAVDDLVEAAHGGGALQQHGVDTVGEAVTGHRPRHRLVRWEAVQDLHRQMVEDFTQKRRDNIEMLACDFPERAILRLLKSLKRSAAPR